MTSVEYNIIALLALIIPTVLQLAESKDKKSLLGFLVLYGISFLIILLAFWLIKVII